MTVQILPVSPSSSGQPITLLQSPETRAINVGYIQDNTFIPGRLLFGALREQVTYTGTVQSLVRVKKSILSKYKPEQISTVTVLRETVACHLSQALWEVGVKNHYGDAFIGATHIKGNGEIKTAYLYENTEGLTPDGLWIIAESFCVGRNLLATMKSLLAKYHPAEILFIGTLCTRYAINNVGAYIAQHNIPTSYIAWGALFGLDQKTLYDMPWGHSDTEPLDPRDHKTFVDMYGPKLCVGGDFGNAYYGPIAATELYEAQLKEHGITPNIPTVEKLKNIYKPGELWEYRD